MKLSFKYLIFMFILLLMPICNVRAYEGKYIENQRPSNIIDYAKDNSDIYFIKENINFDKCKPRIEAKDPKVGKNIELITNVYGGNVIVVKNNLLKDISSFTTVTNDNNSTLKITMDCAEGAEDIKTNKKYDVEIVFSHLKLTKPDILDVGGKDLIILADTSKSEYASDEFPLGLGLVSKLAGKNKNGNYVAYDTYDGCNGKQNCGVGVTITTTITLKSDLSKKVAFLFQDLDRPDVATAGVLNGTIGPYDFGGGAEFAESLALRHGFNSSVFYRRDTRLSFYSEQSKTNCPGMGLCVVKPSSGYDGNNFLIFSDASSSNQIVFNWCGSNAHTAIGFLYFPKEVTPPTSTDIWHNCNLDDDITFINNVGCYNNSLTDYAQRIGNVVMHSSCKFDNVLLSDRDIYIESNVDLYPRNADGSMGAATKCEKVNLQFPIVLLENINFDVSDLYYTDGNRRLNKIYAGGGFNWDGASLKNTISYVYRYYKDDGSHTRYSQPGGNFKYIIHHEYFKKNKDGSYSTLDFSTAYLNDDIKFYKDSSCSGGSQYHFSLSDYVASQIASHIQFKNSLLVNSNNSSLSHFKSINPNNASSQTLEPLRVTDSGVSTSGNVYDESISLNQSWINPKTAEISFSSNGGNYIDGGNKWYVPLKYLDNIVEVKANSLNISRIRYLPVNVSCPIDVEHILYEPDGNGGLKLAYRYRPIKLNNVFNGKKKVDIAQNWQDWYCGNDADCDGGNDNKTRLEETYEKYKANNPLYRITLNDSNGSDIRAFNNNNSYISFNNFNTGNPASGTSSFVSKYFNGGNGNILKAVPDTHYCGLGVFKPTIPGKKGCDQRW